MNKRAEVLEGIRKRVRYIRKGMRPSETDAQREERMREYQRRVGAVRRLLERFEQRFPYTGNVAERIVQWAERGFGGEP